MIRIAHVLNPFDAPDGSDLHRAQPITFESLRIAAEHARDVADVRQHAVTFPEDRQPLPGHLDPLPHLERSVQDVGTFRTDRRLPLLADLLERLHAAGADADLLVYSNVDIAVMPAFYTALARLLERGVDASVVNRRMIADRYGGVEDLPLMFAAVGSPHPGRDCFVFRASIVEHLDVGDVAVGADWVGRVLTWNLALRARRFVWLTDAHLTFHLGDDRAWEQPRFDEYAEFNRQQAVEVRRRLEAEVGPLRRRADLRPHLPPPGFLEDARLAGAARSLRRSVGRLRALIGA